jgi:predicted dinucleotide-utilizing enzyme
MTTENTEQTTETVETTEQTTEQVSTPEKSENMIPKSRFDQVNQQKKDYEKQLNEVADMILQDLPEEYRELFADLPAQQKIAKVKMAQSKGLFNMAKVEDIPGSEAPKSSKSADFSSMSTEEKIKTGYKK